MSFKEEERNELGNWVIEVNLKDEKLGFEEWKNN